MSNEVATQNADAPAGLGRDALPASLVAGINAGAVSIEIERAVAEVKGQIYLAKSFPRNLTQSHIEIMESCRVLAFAEKAFYKKPQGKKDGVQQHVTGESIRMAEELARVVGNFDYGHRELSRTDGKSEIEVYAWDKEKNNKSVRQITVAHVIDTREGPRKLRDQTDIDNKIANVASKQMRGRILALVPKWLVALAVEECRKTIANGGGESIQIRVRAMVARFAFYGVTVEHLEKYMEKSTDAFTGDDLAELFGIYNAIKEGETPADYFTPKDPAESAEKPTIGPKPGEPSDQPHPATAAASKRQAAKKDAAKAPAADAGELVAETTKKPAAETKATTPAADPNPQAEKPETRAEQTAKADTAAKTKEFF